MEAAPSRAPSPTVVLASSSLGAVPARLRTFPRRELALCGARSFPTTCRALCRAKLLTMALLLPAASSLSSALFHGAQPAASRPQSSPMAARPSSAPSSRISRAPDSYFCSSARVLPCRVWPSSSSMVSGPAWISSVPCSSLCRFRCAPRSRAARPAHKGESQFEIEKGA
uniref:Uncharacterized protein n=1 Tax=Zea mays TaxID=4577 RepID=A0A804RHF4_MAIZE